MIKISAELAFETKEEFYEFMENWDCCDDEECI